jgi:hypothetical protein
MAKSFESSRAMYCLTRYEPDELPGCSTPQHDYNGPAISRQIDIAVGAANQAARHSHQVLYGVPSAVEVNGELECTSTIPLFV